MNISNASCWTWEFNWYNISSTVDASQAGEGNLEITISARGQNIPTQVTPQGNARFSVSFVPFEACEHVINIAFNKKTVPGCPIVTRVGGDSHVTVSGQALSSAGLGRQSYLTVSNVAGSLEDLEVNVEGNYRAAWDSFRNTHESQINFLSSARMFALSERL